MLIFLLLTKHFLVDFFLQTPYQYLNKGTYGHLGGILHATLHGLATLGILLYISHEYAILFSVLDAVIHYHIDYFKVVINRKYNYCPTKDAKYWYLLGLDQYLHNLTYLLIVLY